VDLAAYFERVRFTGDVKPDLATLQALHRAHQYSVPFENLDVQLRRPVGLDRRASFEKIVRARRGGWCYEMNGLFEWVLREIGFDVMRMSAGVMRETQGEQQLGNHLCLRVKLDQPYLVDVGFGGSLSAPLPLRKGLREDPPYRIELHEIDDGYWRFSERTDDKPFTFDFRAAPADEALFVEKSRWQQTDPASPFIQTLVVQRRTVDTHVSLRGRVLSITHAGGSEDKTVLESPDELVAALRSRFDLDVPEAATLWPAICARHDAVFSKPRKDD
jgi:N-hydroxyarylamine O-acetyltransferase